VSLARNDETVTRARAPLRIGLAGGGTDLSPYSDEFGGAVLNCTIDRFAHAFIRSRRDGKVAFVAKDLGIDEVLADLDEVRTSRLPLHRGAYLRMVNDFNGGKLLPITLTTSVDVPAGSGLGSSSALVVAMAEAFDAYLGLSLGQYDVAHLAFEIERIDLGLSGGKQDQYSAAFGGMNFIEFLPGDRVIVNPLRISAAILNEFESSLITCFSGNSRDSAAIISEQVGALSRQSAAPLEAMHRLKEDAIAMKSALLQGRIGEVGDILNRSWESKKQTAAGISNSRLDHLYNVAISRGALAGKVSGAGGGGYMMFLSEPEDKLAIIGALSEAGAVATALKLTHHGAETWQIRR
jgi:D-glycero-alpha-D-manno-heptose-7-phosphate kinase